MRGKVKWEGGEWGQNFNFSSEVVLHVQSWPLKCAQPIKPKITPKKEIFAPSTYKIKCATDSGHTLQLDVPTQRHQALRQAPAKKEVTDPLDLRNLRNVKLRQGLIKCRDRHRRARPIICGPFWAVMSSLCVAISLFLSLPPFLPCRH